MLSTYSKGTDFENKVAELYRLMGYVVERNVGVLGHQIDLILTYSQPGGIDTKTAVQCKYIEDGNLTKNAAMDNINALGDLMRNSKVQNAIIITTNAFSKDLWDTARENNIKLMTFCELQHQILKLDSYINGLITRFENDELSSYYVDIFANEEEKTSEKAFLINDYIYKWVDDPNANHLSILGEYGTGKTSFCRKLAHDLAIGYQKDNLKSRIPIMINLKDYSKVMSVRQLITDLLINEYGIQSINFPLFEKMNDEGLFLLIFDGFDEMAQKVDFDVAFTNFSMIAELAKPRKSKVILTCRLEFFRTHEKEREILIDIDKRDNFDIIYLQQFNDDQIRNFLKKRVPLIESQNTVKKGWEYYSQKIQDVFDLKDLAKRPVLLDLIVKYLPKLIQENTVINAATLYKTAISEELKRRLKVGTTIIQRDDRIKLMKLLATWMYNNEKLLVHYERIPELVRLKDNFSLKTSHDIEFHLNDFLTCSFLNRDVSGNYRFSHKSLVDFLVAWKFADDVQQNITKDFLQKPITHEIVQFMKDLNISSARLYDWINLTRTIPAQDVRYLGGNSVTILNELGEKFKNKKFDFSKTKLFNARFDGQDLDGLKFSRAILKDASLNNASLKSADFSFANLSGVSFEKIGPVYTLACSPDSLILAGAGYGKNIELWGIKGSTERRTLRGHNDSVSCVAFSPDGKYLVSGSHDRNVIVWSVPEYKELKRFEEHRHSIKGLAFSPNSRFLATAGYDGLLIIWDMIDLKLARKLYGHNDSVLSVAFSPDGKYLVSGSHDKTIIVWDAVKFTDIARLSDVLSIKSLAFNSDCSQLASIGIGSYAINIWNITDKKIVARISLLSNPTCAAFSPDGNLLVSGDQNGGIKIWSVKAGFKEVATVFRHKSAVNCLAFSLDGKYLLTACQDEAVKLWKVDTHLAKWELVSTYASKIDCDGMIIDNAILSYEAKRLLMDNGAIDDFLKRQNYRPKFSSR